MLACHYNAPMFFFSPFLLPTRMPRTQAVLYKKDDQRTVKPIYRVISNSTETLLQVELPGVAKEDVTVECDTTRLIITAKKQVATHIKREHQANESGHKLPTIHYKLRLLLGKHADIAAISNASYENGVLNIHIPYVAEHQPRQIEIPQ